MIKSVYIHIPFCKSICSYCDFCKFYYNSNLVNKYLTSLENEIKLNYQKEVLDTLYIGGGTPSSLNIDELNKLFCITNKLKLNNNYEFTIECNVLDINEQKLKLFKENKVNRLSIGIQSFNKNILNILERNYTYEDIIEKIELAKKYFTNINIDLIYAVPNETIDDLNKDIDMFLKLDIPHISTYSLIIEEHTKLYLNSTKYIDEELDRQMYDLICKRLEENNYSHYEISNFSKSNYNSKHNLTYWMNKEYYGFGLGSSGYINNIRYTNTKNLNKYLESNYEKIEEILTKEDTMEYEVITGFRTSYGIDKNEFINKYGIDLVDHFNIKDLLDKNILILDNNRYFINKDYWYTLNNILLNFIK